MTTRPTHHVVLVHGAFADGSSWSDVIVRLQARGYGVTAVQNPLTSLADDATATRRVLERIAGPIILVGHSWGGAVISQAGMMPNVAALVYVSALAPDRGESVVDLQVHDPSGAGMEGVRPDDHGRLWFDPALYGQGLAADLPVERAALLAATQQPITASAFEEALTAAAWRNRPVWYLVSEVDRALRPSFQHWSAARMSAKVRVVPSSHMSLISHPDAVVDLIDDADRR